MIDPKKAIHLVYSSSGKGNLENYFKTNFPDENIKIHCIYNDLTAGPLNDLNSTADYETYLSYWKAIDKIYSQDEVENDFQFPDLAGEFSIDFPENQSLIIWHGNETGEKLMLYRYCNLLHDKDLYEVNLDDWPTPSEHNYKNNCLATRNPEHLDGILNIVKKIDDSRKSFYAKEWEKLKKDEKLNRILKDGKVISVAEDYYDKSILDNCTSEYKNAATVIGETMGHQENSIGDYYLLYRVRILINQNLLEWKGNLAAMRYFEIRKK